jgi:hypothetical protein
VARASIAGLAFAVLVSACGTEPATEATSSTDDPASSVAPTTSTTIPATTTTLVATTIDPTTPTNPASRVVLVRNIPAGSVSVQGRAGASVRITRCDHGTVAVGTPVLEVIAHCTLSVGEPHRLDADGTATIPVPPPGSDLTGRPLAEDADVVAIDADTAIPVGVVG